MLVLLIEREKAPKLVVHSSSSRFFGAAGAGRRRLRCRRRRRRRRRRRLQHWSCGGVSFACESVGLLL